MRAGKGAGSSQWVKAGAAVVALAAAVFIGVRAMSSSESAPIENAYYYNLATGQLTVARKGGIPPFNLPPEGLVQANVFSCGDCAVEAERFIGWLESYNDEALAKLREASGKTLDPATASQLMFDTQLMRVIAPPPPPEGGKDLKWLPQDSPEVAALQMRVIESCKGPDGSPRGAASCTP